MLVKGEGFKPGSVADVWVFSTPVKLGSLTVDSDGTFRGMLPLPPSLAVGNHTVQINGVSADEETTSLSVGIRLASARSGLAATGTHVKWAFALQLMCAGFAMLMVARRRRDA